MSPWERLLERPQPRGHFVQLSPAGNRSLARNVGIYLGQGLIRGDGALVIATPENRELFRAELLTLGVDVEQAVASSQLVLLDAHETMAQFLTGEQPNEASFERVVGAAIRRTRPVGRDCGLRGYGEMVGVLWQARRYAAAARLERLWNRLLASSSFSLYCAYPVDVFDPQFNAASVESILNTHTHLVPCASDRRLNRALNAAMKEAFGDDAESLRGTMRAHRNPAWALLPEAEASILWLRKERPSQAEAIVKRASELYYCAE